MLVDVKDKSLIQETDVARLGMQRNVRSLLLFWSHAMRDIFDRLIRASLGLHGWRLDSTNHTPVGNRAANFLG